MAAETPAKRMTAMGGLMWRMDEIRDDGENVICGVLATAAPVQPHGERLTLLPSPYGQIILPHAHLFPHHRIPQHCGHSSAHGSLPTSDSAR